MKIKVLALDRTGSTWPALLTTEHHASIHQTPVILYHGQPVDYAGISALHVLEDFHGEAGDGIEENLWHDIYAHLARLDIEATRPVRYQNDRSYAWGDRHCDRRIYALAS